MDSRQVLRPHLARISESAHLNLSALCGRLQCYKVRGVLNVSVLSEARDDLFNRRSEQQKCLLTWSAFTALPSAHRTLEVDLSLYI